MPQSQAASALPRTHIPIGLALLAVSLLLPSELSFYADNLRLTIYRVVLILLTPIVLFRLGFSRRFVFAPADVLFIFAAMWIFLSLGIANDWSTALQSGGINFLETVVPYLLARQTIVNEKSFAVLARVLVWTSIPLVVIGLIEAVTHSNFIHAYMRETTGQVLRLQNEVRLGLLRAQGPFDHPIHFGVWNMLLLAPAIYGRRIGEFGLRGIFIPSLVGVLISLSSGPWIGAFLQLFLIVYERLTRKIENRWLYLVAAFFVSYVATDLFSNRGAVKVFISYAALYDFSAYYRTIEFDIGMANVAAHPLFGIGFHDFTRLSWMNNSIDNYWLLVAMQYGIPALSAYALGILALVLGIAATPAPPGKVGAPFEAWRYAWSFVVVSIIFVGATVDYWHELQVLVWLFLGAGGWMMSRDQSVDWRVRTAPVARLVGTRPR